MMRQRFRFWMMTAWVLPILAVGVGTNAVRAADEDGGGKVYKQLLPSTVWVVTPLEGRHVMTGTGTLIDVKNRLILTNYHVVQDKDEVFVFFPMIQKNGMIVNRREDYIKKGTRIPGKVKCRSSKKDLALIELQAVPRGARAIKLAATSPTPGTHLHSIGNPGVSDALWAYTDGTVRQVYPKRFMTSGGDGEKGFQVDATIVETTSLVNKGDSGGPVVNSHGDLVAVTQGHLNDSQARGYSIFIDVSEVKQFLKDHKIRLTKSPLVTTASQPTEDKPAAKPPAEDAAAKAERDATRELKLAKLDLADPNYGAKARKRLQNLVKKYPHTKAADEARELLKK